MSLRKQIDALQKKRNEHLDAMEKVSELAANDNRLFTPDEQAAFEKDQGQVRDIDAQLVRLEEAEKQLGRTARPAPSPLVPGHTAQVIEFKAFPGQAFTRFVGSLALAKGNIMQACEIAKRWDNETPEVLRILKQAANIGSTNDERWLMRAAVAAGTTTNATWAGPLVDYQRMTAEFIELLRPETVFGRLTGYRTVPFNIKIPRQTAGASAGWVGEGASKPVSALAFDDVTMPWAKIAVIVVITQELARFSTPSAEQLVRDDLIATIAQFIDVQMLDDAVTALANVRPASITNAAAKVPSTGSTVAAVTTDLVAAIASMTQPPNIIPMRRPVWIMDQAAASFLATLRTAQDIFAFPSMSNGGAPGVAGANPSLLGIPVLVSPNAGAGNIILLEQTELMLADDGEVLIDTSTEASVQLDSAPPTPAINLVSLWQQNLLGIKAERFIYWMMRRAAAVVEITGFPAP